MKYIVRTLTLNNAITVKKNEIAADGTVSIMEYHSRVTKKDLEPSEEDHITNEGTALAEIKAGIYLFTQAEIKDDAPPQYTEAVKSVWLESLWLDVEFKTDRILIRTLSEDSKKVFQIFREIIGDRFPIV